MSIQKVFKVNAAVVGPTAQSAPKQSGRRRKQMPKSKLDLFDVFAFVDEE